MLQIELYGGDQMNQLTFDRNRFYLDGRPFRIISGDIHYFRIHEKDWGKRLDLGAFLKLCGEKGLKVLLRPAPYICSEWDFGVNFRAKPGFNLGRYDSAGPQLTLYLPGHFLKEKDNELIMLDLDPVGEKTTVDCLDHEIPEGEAEELR